MPWQPKPTAAKYRTAEHQRRRKALAARIKAGEQLECTAKVCLFNREPITNPNGNQPDGLHLGHHDDGITYRGPEHRACNLHDAAVRANARSRGISTPTSWVL